MFLLIFGVWLEICNKVKMKDVNLCFIGKFEKIMWFLCFFFVILKLGWCFKCVDLRLMWLDIVIILFRKFFIFWELLLFFKLVCNIILDFSKFKYCVNWVLIFLFKIMDYFLVIKFYL